MSQCQNFFDDMSPSVCKSSSSNEQQSSPASTTIDGNMEGADHHLELCLGRSVDVSKPKQHEMVRPIPLYPTVDRQRSGNYGNATGNLPLFRGHSDASLAEKALFSKDSAFSTPPLISREQVWQSLQNTNGVLGLEPRGDKALCDDAASSMMGRRSTSMQILMPTNNESSEVGACPIRRSCSNGIPPGLLSRQSSFGQEALVDESPDPTNSLAYHHQQDALEFQKKKEMQAHRRLEARKRRRLLIDKQQKKARQNSGLINRQSISPVDKPSIVRMRSLDRKYSLESKPLNEVMGTKLVDEEMRGKKQVKDEANGGTLPPLQGFNIEQDHPMHKECESTGSGSKHMQGDLSSVQQMIASCDLSGHKEDRGCVQSGKVAEMFDVAKRPHSSCSETESSETKDFSERESSSQKSSTEKYLDNEVSATVTPPSKPMLYPRTLPNVHSPNSKAQIYSSHHTSPKFPPTHTSRKEGLHARHRASSHSTISELLSNVPNNLTIKRSVGVFAEGKWRIPDDDLASPPIRRTASNINEVLPEPQRPPKKLESYASLSASQLKFAGMVCNDGVGASFTRRRNEMRPKFSSRLPLHERRVKDELDALAVDEKPVFGAKGPGRTTDTSAAHMLNTPIKVKQEEDVMEDEILQHSQPAVSKMEVEPINRQTSGSLLELPWVTTTGSGPNGRTINGVMYITGGRSVMLVCRCHGKHMSPAEFVEHAGSTDLSNPLKNIVVNPFPMVNQLASTPV